MHIDGVVNAIQTLMHSDQCKGVFNITSPQPLTQNDLGKAIGEELERPHWFPVPRFVLKVVLGEQSDMILNTQKVLPMRLKSQDFNFKFPTVKEALKDLL